jgi:cellulose synthase/poly-beta-1,6-N-acetylglucosamine synthase-like glycosyltransferase
LESLKNQDFKDFEIIVVDNNSTDKTAEIPKKFGQFYFLRKIKESPLQGKRDFKALEEKLLLLLTLTQFCQKIGFQEFLRSLKKIKIWLLSEVLVNFIQDQFLQN